MGKQIVGKTGKKESQKVGKKNRKLERQNVEKTRSGKYKVEKTESQKVGKKERREERKMSKKVKKKEGGKSAGKKVKERKGKKAGKRLKVDEQNRTKALKACIHSGPMCIGPAWPGVLRLKAL